MSMSEANSAIELTIDPRDRSVGAGTVRRLLPFRTHRMVGPFTLLDIMGPEDLGPGQGMDIDAHPHIGLSTLTYLLEGRALHRDSTGAVQTIEAGAVNWMTAGSGVTHTERTHPNDRGINLHVLGVQIWVALPGENENEAPRFEHCDAHEVPELTVNGAIVRIAAGAGWNAESPVIGSSPLVLADIRLDDSVLEVPTDHLERAVLALEGDIRLGGTALATGSLAVLEPNSRPSLSGTGTALVIGGEPVGRRHIWWNFVHSDPDVIEDAKARWLRQDFPTVPGDHGIFVPLPG